MDISVSGIVTDTAAPGAKLARPHRRRSRARSRTVPAKRMRAEVRAHAMERAVGAELLAARPRTRGDCIGRERPCPWLACRHHLYLDVNPETGSIKINFPDLEPWELEHTCALDVAERGAITLEEVGEIMNLTRERVRQVEVDGLLAIGQRAPGLGDIKVQR
jgi:Sigma-70, region 4